MITAAVILILVAGLVAGVARLRMWWYDRQDRRQFAEFAAADTQRNMLRTECSRLWWERQK